MKILTIDTSAQTGCVAISENESILADVQLNLKNRHNESLVEAIAGVTEKASVSLSQVGAYAIAIGPGSFTGLRIGLAMVKGLTFVHRKPVVAVNTLDTLAFAFGKQTVPVIALIEARADQAFWATFGWSGDILQRKSEYKMDQVKDILAEADSAARLVAAPSSLLPADRRAQRQPIQPEMLASALTRRALGMVQQEQFSNIAALEPFYLHDFVPKRKAYYAD